MERPWLFVGCRVVCVEKIAAPRLPGEIFPEVGATYTVRSIEEASSLSPRPGELCTRLEEILNTPQHFIDGFMECQFFIERFRPVSTIDTTKTVEAMKQAIATLDFPNTDPVGGKDGVLVELWRSP